MPDITAAGYHQEADGEEDQGSAGLTERLISHQNKNSNKLSTTCSIRTNDAKISKIISSVRPY